MNSPPAASGTSGAYWRSRAYKGFMEHRGDVVLALEAFRQDERGYIYAVSAFSGITCFCLCCVHWQMLWWLAVLLGITAHLLLVQAISRLRLVHVCGMAQGLSELSIMAQQQQSTSPTPGGHAAA